MVVDALRAVFVEDLTCAILKGSVFNGDWIPHFSDLDIHAFIRGIGPDRTPAWPQAVAFQARIGALDPGDYGVNTFQITFIDSDTYPKDWVPPWPGTFEVLEGDPPSTFAQADQNAYVEHARSNLHALPGWTASLTRSYVDKPDHALPRLVRFAGTFLKGALYDSGIILTEDPKLVLTAVLPELLAIVGGPTGSRQALSQFYAGAMEWRHVRAETDALRVMFSACMTAFDAIMQWHKMASRA